MTPLDLDARTVRLERTYDAPADAVFAAWTDPEVLRRWWRADPEHDTAEVDLDLRVGGAYRLAMHDPRSGETHVVFGEYRVVQPPERLVYSWTWEGTGPYAGHESLVTVDFRAEGERTTVVIEHAGLLDDRSREAHGHGWKGVLESLASVVPG